MDLDPGQLVAQRFRILRPLGRGGMGEVFCAENLRTGRQVAIKLLRSESKQKSSAIERFRREARAAGSIQSDFVTQILDVDEDPEHGIVLVFELLEGESLVERLKRTGPIPFDELHPMIEQVWMGLADAHRAGIIHRDLKPSNVFLERRPNGGVRVKLLDFGISKLPREMGGETLTEMGQSLGTFSFMPPEQIGKAKTVDHRADIYACASLIYQALSGQLPYAAKNILMMVELKTKQEPRRLSQAMDGPIDPRLDDFLAIALAREPENRFQSADDALAAWRELAGTQAGRAASSTGRSGGVPSPFVTGGHGAMHADRHGSQGHPGQGHPGPGHPGQAHQGHTHPGQGHPGQGHPGQGHQGHTHQGQGHQGQAHHAQSHQGHASQPHGGHEASHAPRSSHGGQGLHAPMSGHGGYDRPSTPMYGSQPRLEVSVPRVNTSNDSWDDSAPPSESGTGEDIATVAIRRDQVGQALAAYGRGPVASSPGRVDLAHDDVRTTNQGTVMMITKPGVGGSMHRARSSPGPAAGQGAGQPGMMAPALMPPMAPPGQDPSRMSLPGVPPGDLAHRVTPPEAPRSSSKLVVVAVVLAVVSFGVIAALLQLVGR